MAIVVFVATAGSEAPVVGPDAVERLQALGITRIVLLRDDRLTGVVLEGWAFDPARSDDATRAIFPGRQAGLRSLHEFANVELLAARPERSTP
jgi:hypothetical protein